MYWKLIKKSPRFVPFWDQPWHPFQRASFLQEFLSDNLVSRQKLIYFRFFSTFFSLFYFVHISEMSFLFYLISIKLQFLLRSCPTMFQSKGNNNLLLGLNISSYPMWFNCDISLLRWGQFHASNENSLRNENLPTIIFV